jgi:threonine/homoserine/homoserine lactone efflux protein
LIGPASIEAAFVAASRSMFNSSFAFFLAAALLVAVTPGPGIFYVAARSLAGGRREGLASSVGLGLGGLVHVLAGAAGLSALVLASADAFTLLKLAGAAYLIWLGIKTIGQARVELPREAHVTGAARALREGVVVESLNPKTAAFFLAFIPHFVDPAQGQVALQFMAFGVISVALNTLADIAVVVMASRVRNRFRPGIIRRLHQASGIVMCGLGASLAFARRSP